MDYKGYRHIPRALFDAITFLAGALPKRSVPTFLELLFGAMLTQTGFVTDAYLAIDAGRHWNSYYKWLHFGLARQGGNSGKLVAAKTLLRVIVPLFEGFQTILLMDSWYMRRSLISYALNHGLQVIGQVRRDTALFHLPERTGKRGRPRKYGDKVSAEWVDSLPEVSMKCLIYGKTQMVYYRSAIVLARFLNGRAARVILNYGRRWSVEDLFNQLKNRWGWKETWQQSRQVLHRWVQILSLSYAIPQLLVLFDDAKVKVLASFAPWRQKQPITAGRVRQGLQRFFDHVNIRAMWHPKSGKFGHQKQPVEDVYHPKRDKVA